MLLLEMVVDEVGDDLGIGLGFEHVPEHREPGAMLLMVLDDAVVHYRDLTHGDVGMGIGLGDAAVGGPARVTDARDPGELLRRRLALHLGDATDAAYALDAAVQHGDAGGVVAPVFQALQALYQQRYYVPPRHRSHYPAHKRTSI